MPSGSDLSNQIKVYLKKIDRDLEDLGSNPNFEDGVDSLFRDANIIVLLAVAVSLSPDDTLYKQTASELAAAAQKCASVTNLDEAKAAVAELKAAADSTGNASSLQWDKMAHLSPLMKKGLPNIITEIKRLGRNEKTLLRSGNLDKVTGDAAALTVIALGCRSLVTETQAPSEEELWTGYCDRLYEKAYTLNKAADSIRSGSGTFDAFSAALKDLDATCNTSCHEKFGGSTR